LSCPASKQTNKQTNGGDNSAAGRQQCMAYVGSDRMMEESGLVVTL